MPTAISPIPIPEFALPFISAASPTEVRPHFISGQNAIINVGGWLARRPGFAKYVNQTIVGTINNIFVYTRWNGNSYIMLSVADGADSKVYKLLVGTDTSFSSILTTTGTTIRFDFDVSGNYLYFCNGTDNKKWDGTTVTNWGIAGGADAPAASQAVGALTSSQGGWSWVYCFGNSTTKHIGAASPASAATGNVTLQKFTITGNDSTDAQVDKVHIFRTKDGGSTLYEHPSSPIAYAASWSLVDNSADSTLVTSSVAPAFNQNKRPTASRGATFHVGRMWVYSGSVVYYSVAEEGINGVDVESFPSGNKYDFGDEVVRIVRVGKALLIFTRRSVWRIRGDSLDTFLREPFLNSYGAEQAANCTNSGKAVVFLDVSGNLIVTDGMNVLNELSQPIAPDIDGISQTSASVIFHKQGRRTWFIIQDSSQNKMWVFDQKAGIWNLPWTFGGSAIWSGRLSSGTNRLFIAKSGVVYYLDTAIFSDDGTGYTCQAQTGLFKLVPEIADPDWVGSLEHVMLRTSALEPTSVKYQIDDDPTTATYTTVASANVVKSPYRAQGIGLVEKNYHILKSGTHASIQINWNNATTEWKLYSGSIQVQGEVTGVQS